MPPPVVLLLFIDSTFPFKSRSGAAGEAIGLFVFYRPTVASWKTLGALLGAQTAGLVLLGTGGAGLHFDQLRPLGLRDIPNAQRRLAGA